MPNTPRAGEPYPYAIAVCPQRGAEFYPGETCESCGWGVPEVRWPDGSRIVPSPVYPDGVRSMTPTPHPSKWLRS